MIVRVIVRRLSMRGLFEVGVRMGLRRRVVLVSVVRCRGFPHPLAGAMRVRMLVKMRMLVAV